MVNFGKLNKLIEIQSLVKTSDGCGGFTETWSTLHRVYGKEIIKRADTINQANQQNSVIKSKWRTRFASNVTAEMRIVVDGRTFTIDAVYDPSQRRESLEIICTELQNPGV